MKPIQPILLLSLGLVVWYFGRLRSRSRDRILAGLLGLTGLIAIVSPDWTHRVAHLLGVGRGADLLIYLGIITASFAGLMLYTRIRRIDAALTQMARSIAISEARTPGDSTPDIRSGIDERESQ